jgi:hypothetical protein
MGAYRIISCWTGCGLSVGEVDTDNGTYEDRAIRAQLHVFGASLLRSADGAGDVGLRESGSTARHWRAQGRVNGRGFGLWRWRRNRRLLRDRDGAIRGDGDGAHVKAGSLSETQTRTYR